MEFTESGAQLVARISSNTRPSLVGIGEDIFPDGGGGPAPKKLVEISGESNSGKSQLIMEIMARSILPMDYGGRDCEVVFLNADNNFQLLRFLKILEKLTFRSKRQVETTVGETDEQVQKEVIDKSLRNIHIINSTPEEYDINLIYLEDHLSSNVKIGLIAIDSINAFYWSDHKNLIKMGVHFRKMTAKLKGFCTAYKMVCVYTRPNDYAETIVNRDIDYKFELISQKSWIEAKINYSHNCFKKIFTIDNFGVKFLD